MAFDFPTKPAVNDTFADSVSGAAYVWAGTKWWRTKAATKPNPKPPPPIISSLVPNLVNVGDPSPVTISVRGGIYQAGSVVQLGGVPAADTRATNFVSASELTFSYTIPLGSTVVQVTVLNPDGLVSAPQPLTVSATPIITSITPTTAPWSTGNVPITVVGTGFNVSGADVSVVYQGGTALTTVVASATQCTATLIAPSGQGSDAITVRNGAVASAPQTFTWSAAIPVLNSINPTSSSIIGGNRNVSCYGAYYEPTGQGMVLVYVDGVENPTGTGYISSTECMAMLQPPATPKTVVITLRNGGTAPSAPQNFTWT